MAIKIYEKFAPRANPADGDYPYGSIKNESVPGAKDGTPLDAEWGNDYAGFDAELFAQASVVPNGVPDKLGASQRVDAMRKMFESVGTVESLAEGNHPVGTRVSVTDRDNEVFLVQVGGTYNGSYILNAGGGNIAVLQNNNAGLSVKAFGECGLGGDDRETIQSALDYIVENGGELIFPKPEVAYSIKSTHPVYTDHALVLDLSVITDIYTRGNIKLTGFDYLSKINLDTPELITSLLYVPFRTNYLTMSNMFLEGNKKCDYTFLCSDEYSPYMYLSGCKFYGAKLASARISTFVATFRQCIFGTSDQDGLRLAGIGSGPVTSVSLISCYAVSCARRGFDCGYLTYCSFTSCAADRCGLAYYITIASGVSFNGSGCETCGKAMQVEAYRGLAINTFYMLTVGSEDINNPEPYLIELISGYGATLQGVRKESGRYYTYLLGSTGNSTGNENITVLDGTLNRDTVYFVPSVNYTRPIKFLRGDEVTKVTNVNISTAAELNSFFVKYSHYKLEYDLTINLAAGDYDLSSLQTNIDSMAGPGELVIAGVSASPTAVRLFTNGNRFRILSCGCKVTLKDIVISGNVSNNSYTRLTVYNSPRVFLDRVVINKNSLNVGTGINVLNGSRVTLLNGSGVDSASFAVSPIVISSDSKVCLEPLASDPLLVGWVNGIKYYKLSPESGSGVGRVYTATGWKDFGTVAV